MPDNGDRILSAILEMKNQVLEIHQKTADTNTEVKVLSQKMENVEKIAIGHHELLYGDPKQAGSGGLLGRVNAQDTKIDGIGRRLDSFKSFFVLIWTGIFTVIQLAFTALKNFFSGSS